MIIIMITIMIIVIIIIIIIIIIVIIIVIIIIIIIVVIKYYGLKRGAVLCMKSLQVNQRQRSSLALPWNTLKWLLPSRA